MTNLYNPNDGLTGRDGGPYLDEVQAQEAEKRRAAIEGRKPDLDNPGADAGIPLSRPAEILSSIGVNMPSKQHTFDAEVTRIFANAVDNADTELEVSDTINDAEVSSQKETAVKTREDDLDVSQSDLFTREAAGNPKGVPEKAEPSKPAAKPATSSK